MPVRRYAEGTDVDVSKTKADIERLLSKHGATGFAHAWEGGEGDRGGRSILMFRLRGRMLRYEIERANAENYAVTGKGRLRHKSELAVKAAEKENKRRWRALYLIIRAKLEIVESSDDPSITFDREFMADICLPNGRTVGDVLVPEIAKTYETGKAPKLLLSDYNER